MSSKNAGEFDCRELLKALVAEAGLDPLTEFAAGQFSSYLELFLRWNGRTNLSSIRDPELILRRHFLESIHCAQNLSPGIGTLLDFGSGGGLPGIPISILRSGIQITLAESQNKKAAFLNEVVRSLGLSARVHSGRAESLTGKFDCVTLRAVDRMSEATRAAVNLLAPSGWLVLMTTESLSSALIASANESAGGSFAWSAPKALPGSDRQIILSGQKSQS